MHHSASVTNAAASTSSPPGPTGPDIGAGSDAAAAGASAKEIETAAKFERTQNMWKKPKTDDAATHPVWLQRYFEVYVSGKYSEVPVCSLCVKNNDLSRAELKFTGKSPNLVDHLNTPLLCTVHNPRFYLKYSDI